MNNLTNRNVNKKSNILFMVLFFMLLSCGTSFAQTVNENKVDITTNEKSDVANTNMEMNTMKQQDASVESNMNFILWFMGSKQSPNSSVLPIGTSAKKQFMTSGTEPNRLLIKAFLKKAVNFESSVV